MNIYEFEVCVDHGEYPMWYEQGVVWADSFESAQCKIREFYHADNVEIDKIELVANRDIYLTDGWNGV